MKTLGSTFFAILLIKILQLSTNASANEILGCGGFIKSAANIDFSKVEVKLLTKSGSLKDKTDCSPSNGYYFLPVYEKGEYVLKISPPPGWSFEPNEIEINFDGQTDVCSQEQDVNFEFKGFGITGEIQVVNQEIGAKDVVVELQTTSGELIRSTKSDQNGVFYFTPINPGKYLIKASHDRWVFVNSQQNVEVKTGNTELPKGSFVVSGFNVNGKVTSDGQPFADVEIAVYIQKDNIISKDPAFLAKSNSDGEYIFKGLAPGSYTLKPQLLKKGVKIHIKPSEISFKVIKDAVTITEQFVITGFSVSGRVLTSSTGWGVSKAVVKSNGKQVAVTHTDGTYQLENVKPGTYVIQVEAPQLQFEDKSVKITPSTTVLPDIVVSAFRVCGQVVSPKAHKVAITKHASTFHTEVESDASTGEWCAFLNSGKYTSQVITSEDDRVNGIQFFPLEQSIEVASSPMSGIMFSQLRATVSGEVKCLPDAGVACRGITVTLNSLDINGKQNGQYITAVSRDGEYLFSGVLPGHYHVVVPATNLCWESNVLDLEVKTASEVVPNFIHKGYSVSISSSHHTSMSYKHTSEGAKSLNMALTPGSNTFCVSNSGRYEFQLIGCHTYNLKDMPKHFSTSDQSPLVLNAIKHRQSVRILSEEKTSYRLKVIGGIKTEIMKFIEEDAKVDGFFAYRYELNLQPEETYNLMPLSDIMLFKPESQQIVGGNDCIDVAFNFIATKGKIIEGKIHPQIEGAQITLTFPKNQDLAALSALSNKDGTFKFGPLDGTLEFDIVASKESYVFAAFDRTTQSFSAHKLCEIVVHVKDEQNNDLSGVLLSLSGAESYRKNLVTGDDGAIKFHSLSPSQYFLRPMMKEYKFEPTSKIIDVKDGETVDVTLQSNRIAFSVFGSINSLNGEPFSKVVVEAASLEPCQQHQEESTSEVNGQYRIRGLQPGCKYSVKVKSDDVDRTIPNERVVTVGTNDVRDVNLIAISPITFVDVTAKIFASSNDYYKTLRIQLYKKGNADSPIYSQRVESPLNPKSSINPGIMVFFPRIPLDGKIYTVELTTTLSEKNYKYSILSSSFVANTSLVFVELEFKPEVKSSENDLNQNSISALLLIALVAVVFFKQELAIDALNFVWSKVSQVAQEVINKSKKKEVKYDAMINENEIDKLAQSINAIKKKKAKKIN